MADSIKYALSNDGGNPASGGTFSNLTNAYADDANLANCLSVTRSQNHTVRYYNFDMGIPLGSIINSVNVEVEWKVDTTASVATLSLQIAKGVTKQGSALTNTSEPTSLTTESTSTNGTWTAAELNDNTSGTGLSVIMSFTQGADNDDINFSWNYLKITVDYDPPSYQTFTKVSGTWEPVTAVSVKVGGSWKTVNAGYKKISGAWQQIY